jgi:hypothetical protein
MRNITGLNERENHWRKATYQKIKVSFDKLVELGFVPEEGAYSHRHFTYATEQWLKRPDGIAACVIWPVRIWSHHDFMEWQEYAHKQLPECVHAAEEKIILAKAMAFCT